MIELIKIRDNGREKVISMFDLYTFLEINTQFNHWCKRMFDYGFEDGRDFWPILAESIGGRPMKDYSINLDVAKEIAMIQRSAKGRQARKYFIECEKKLKEGESPKVLSPKELALLVIKAEEEKERAMMQLDQANKTILTQAPAVQYVNEVLQAQNTHTTTTIAKELGLGAPTLNRLLKEKGIQYMHEGHWVLYHKYQNKGLTKTKTHTYTNSEGKTCTQITTVWTEAGRKFIHEMIAEQKSA